ncbi:hypothetical protein EYC80_002204 [Monilinia laxa]|uniref:Uncharacterized protein n=1 Tax=Monilinia laxa TaxID=61186 RepID=A0A5N6K380_MONLA|nr:hypothetical protein EYC80_002204 [Monilinia laxa]
MPPKSIKNMASSNEKRSKDPAEDPASDSQSDVLPLAKRPKPRGRSRSQPEHKSVTPPNRRGSGRPPHSKLVVTDSDDLMDDSDEDPAESSKVTQKRKRGASKVSQSSIRSVAKKNSKNK